MINKSQRMALCVSVGLALSSLGACGEESESDPATDSGAGSTAGSNNGGNNGGSNGATAGNGTGSGDDGGMDVKDSGTGNVDSGMSKDSGTPPAAPKCTDYCTTIAANCTGDTEQYKSTAICTSVCASFPVGTAADMMGNTLGCRLYHSGAAKADAALHCNHAGITGGDKDPSDTGGGPCGEGCEAFCNAATTVCTGDNEAWPSKADCMTACKTFKPSTDTFDTSDADKDTFNCRAYHLTAAAADAASAMTHCGHIKAVSPVCK